MVSPAAGRDDLAVLERRIDPAARNRFTVEAPESVPLLVAKTPDRFVVAFTTSVSFDVACATEAQFDLSIDRGTEPRPRGAANRSRLRAALAALADTSPPSLISPTQVHGVRVVGAAEYARGLQGSGCDGLTIQPNLDRGLAALLVFADCVPLVLLGEVDGALVHGGWKGLLAGVVQQGAAAMTAPPGLAIIGPSIGPCCYEVSEELAAEFEGRYGEGVVHPGRRLDLWEVATRAVGEVGVPRERVINPRLCTVCNRDLFFSHRADPRGAGRHGAVLWCPDTGEGCGIGVTAGSERT